MSTILAQCKDEKCSTLFLAPVPAIVQSPGTATISVNNEPRKAGPSDDKRSRVSRGQLTVNCPKCGGKAMLPDGTYTIDYQDNGNRKLAKLISGPAKTQQLVKQVEHLIELLEKGNPTKETIISAVAEVSPALAEITRKTASTTNYKEWAALIISLLGLLISIQQGYFKKDDNQGVKQEYLEHLLKENQELKNSGTSAKTPVRAEVKPQPNGPCPCGSNKKFKKCHGLTQPR